LGDLKNILSGIAAFQHLILRRSLGQLTTSFGGFLATCAAMDLCLTISLWITLPLSVLAAGFLVRIFIIQHDCGHGHEWGGKRDEARRNGKGLWAEIVERFRRGQRRETPGLGRTNRCRVKEILPVRHHAAISRRDRSCLSLRLAEQKLISEIGAAVTS
jgi:hypothetical protein